MIQIKDITEYRDYKKRGWEPLANREFEMPISVRIQAQQELFGKGHTPAENERFYEYCWEHRVPMCEECGKPLRNYSRNVNILCFEHHKQWETGKKEEMRIYKKNLRTVEILRRDYVGGER